MNAKASSKKDKKSGEPIQEQLLHKIANFIGTHLNLIGIIALAVIVLIVLIVGWISYQKSLNEKALALEGEAFTLYETMRSATAAESDQATPSSQDVLNAYLKVVEAYPNTESAQRAVYLCGSLAYQMGNYDEAQQYFAEYLKKYPKGALNLYAREGLGYIFEQKGEYQKALENFESIQAKASSSKSSEILLAIARNYEHLENIEAAQETYQKIIDSDTASSWKQTAIERLSILASGHFPPKVAEAEVLEPTSMPTVEEESTPQPEQTPAAEVLEPTSTPIVEEESTPQPEQTPAVEPTAEQRPQLETSPETEADSTPQP